MQSKTLVVMEPTMFSDFNIYIKKAVEQTWKITPFEFVDYKEFEEKRADSTYSFLVLTQTSFERDKSGVHYNFLNLLLGADVRAIDAMPESHYPLPVFQHALDVFLHAFGMLYVVQHPHYPLVRTSVQGAFEHTHG